MRVEIFQIDNDEAEHHTQPHTHTHTDMTLVSEPAGLFSCKMEYDIEEKRSAKMKCWACAY